MFQTVYLIRARKLDLRDVKKDAERKKKRRKKKEDIQEKLERRDGKGGQASELASNLKFEIYISCYTEYKAYGLSLIYNK